MRKTLLSNSMYKCQDNTLDFLVNRIVNNAYLVQSYKDKLRAEPDSIYYTKQIEKHRAILNKQIYALEKYISNK